MLDLRLFGAWKSSKSISQMVMKNGDESHGRIRKTKQQKQTRAWLLNSPLIYPKQPRFGWLWARAAPLPYALYMGIYNTKWLYVHY